MDKADQSRTAGKWYVVRVEPRADSLAAWELHRAGYETISPRVKVVHPKQADAEAPLFPGYLFLRCDLEGGERPSFQIHRMPTNYQTLGFGALFISSLQHLAQDLLVQGYREADDVQRKQGFPPHGVNIAEGVGGGDGAEVEGIIGNGREEVHGRDESGLGVQPKNGSVVPRLSPHQQVGMSNYRHMFQDLAQVLETKLGGSTSAMGHFSQPQFTALHQEPSLRLSMPPPLTRTRASTHMANTR